MTTAPPRTPHVAVALTPEQRKRVERTDVAERVVRQIARRAPGVDLDDVLQEGRLAVSRAAQRYDSSLGVPFDGYAWPSVHFAAQKALQRLLRQRRRMFDGARSAGYDAASALHDDPAAFWSEAAREPAADVADAVDDLAAAWVCGYAGDVARRGGEDELIRRAEHRRALEAVQAAIASLPERERTLIQLRWLEAKSYEEIAAALCISEATVGRHLQGATRLLKARLRALGITDAPSGVGEDAEK